MKTSQGRLLQSGYFVFRFLYGRWKLIQAGEIEKAEQRSDSSMVDENHYQRRAAQMAS